MNHIMWKNSYNFILKNGDNLYIILKKKLMFLEIIFTIIYYSTDRVVLFKTFFVTKRIKITIQR